MLVYLVYRTESSPSVLLDAVGEDEMTPQQRERAVEVPKILLDAMLEDANDYLTGESLLLDHLRRTGQQAPTAKRPRD